MRLTWAAPVSEVTLTYRAGMTGDSDNQHIGIGAISFTDCVAKQGGRGAASARLSLEPVPGSSRSASVGEVTGDDG